VPIYAYRCAACGFQQDALQKLSDAPLTKCPSCGADALKKQVTAAGFQLKGSGWYATDFRDNGAKPKAKPEEGAEAKGSEKDAAPASGEGAKPATDAGDSAPAAKSDAPSASPAPAAASSPAPAKTATPASPSPPPASGKSGR
jgi:putative FmdB family regulatory protein